MTRKTIISMLILTIVVLGFFFASQPIWAVSPSKPEMVENPDAARSDDSKDVIGGQVAVQLNREEINSIAEALAEGEARQMFKEKVAQGEEKDNDSFDDTLRGGEEFSLLFFEGEKAFSRAQGQIVSFFTEPSSTFDMLEWLAALDNLNLGRGFGHLVLTFVIAALFIGPLIAGAGVIGLAIGFGSQTLVRDILSGVFFPD